MQFGAERRGVVGSGALETCSGLQLGLRIMSSKKGSRKWPSRNPCSFHLCLLADVIGHTGAEDGCRPVAFRGSGGGAAWGRGWA